MKKFTPYVIISPFFDVHKNLAIENLLTEKCGENMGILFLWQNSNAVVIGSNQNAFAECNIPLIKNDNIKIARRKTGGGAVFHDRGNINFSFIMPKKLYDEKNQSEVVISAIQKVGLTSQLSGRNDIEINGFKVSGNAYFRGKKVCLQHGTLLVSVDKNNLAKYLTPSTEKLEKKGVASVKSRVKNLCDFDEKINVKVLLMNLCKAFSEKYGQAKVVDYRSFASEDEVYQRYLEFSDEEYILGKFNTFRSTYESNFSWGTSKIEIKVNFNKVIEVFKISTDSMLCNVSWFFEEFFTGKKMEDLSDEKYVTSSFKSLVKKHKSELTTDKEQLLKMVNDISTSINLL